MSGRVEKEQLFGLYTKNGLSTNEIAEFLNCSPSWIFQCLKKFNIPVRSKSEAHKGKPLSEEHRRRISEGEKGRKHSEGTKRKISDANKGKRSGEKNPFYGKHHTSEAKQKMSQVHKGKTLSEGHIEAIRKANKGRRFTEEHKEKIRQASKGRHHTEEAKQKIREARKNVKFPTHHTKPEMIFLSFCKKDTLPFKYTGDSSFWIGEKQPINPDFIHLTKKIAVEIFSYWHDPLRRRSKMRYSYTYEGRKKILKQYGWKLIVFWQEDLEREDGEAFVLSELRKHGGI